MNTKLNNTKFKQVIVKTKETSDSRSNQNGSLYTKLITNEFEPNNKIIGSFKHIIPGNKEWSNSIYSYNKNYVADIPIKSKLIAKLLNNYIHMALYQKANNESGLKKQRIIRRQIRINRRSLKGIIITKPEIKYSNDKAIITIYLLDKEKEFILRKTFFFARSLKLKNVLKLYLNDLTKKDIHLNDSKRDKTSNKIDKFSLQQDLKPSIVTNSRSYNSYIKGINGYKIYKKKLIISLIKKKHFLKNAFFFMFLKWMLLLLTVKVNIIDLKGEKYILIRNSINNNKNIFSIKNRSFLNKLEDVNNILLNILFKAVYNDKKNYYSVMSKEKIIPFLFVYYKKKYLTKFINRYLKKQTLFLHYMYKLSINNFRYNKFTPGIKLIADKIFDKKIDLNFVNLKYLHLDPTILINSIAIRLRKKKAIRLLKVLKRSLKLVKLPIGLNLLSDEVNVGNNYTKSINKLDVINSYKNITVNSMLGSISKNTNSVPLNKDSLNDIITNLFGFLNSNFLNYFKDLSISNRNNLINSIKHKWVKGVRLEAKGRLTKRYTASRSVFKYKYKGNLRGLSYYNNMSSSMSRGNVKSNLIYRFVKSKRRIGAFGIKGWISTY